MVSPQTIQPSTADNYVYQGAATANYGTQTYMEIYNGAGYQRFGLCSFDFHSVVPAGVTITVATFSLYLYSGNAARTIGVYRLLRANWHETQSTYNIFSTGNNWGTVGALNITDNPDYTETDAATSASPTNNHWQTWDVKKQVQTALDSVSGIAHFLIKDTAAGAQAQYYGSREYATANLRPMLYIEYAVPSGVTPNFLPFFWA